jgi:hypothetical protein
MKTFFAALAIVSAALAMPAGQQDHPCGDGYVRAWEDGRYVCDPEEKTVAVFEADCIDKVEVTKGSRIYMTIGWDGKPDKNDWRSEHLQLTIKDNCQPHYEKVKVHQ